MTILYVENVHIYQSDRNSPHTSLEEIFKGIQLIIWNSFYLLKKLFMRGDGGLSKPNGKLAIRTTNIRRIPFGRMDGKFIRPLDKLLYLQWNTYRVFKKPVSIDCYVGETHDVSEL